MKVESSIERNTQSNVEVFRKVLKDSVFVGRENSLDPRVTHYSHGI